MGLTVVAMGLDMSLKMPVNKEKSSYLMKQYLDIRKRDMRPVLENEGPTGDTVESSMDLNNRRIEKPTELESMEEVCHSSLEP